MSTGVPSARKADILVSASMWNEGRGIVKKGSRDIEYLTFLREKESEVGHGVTIEIQDDFDLHRIAVSGQCFRWSWLNDHTVRIIAADQCVHVTEAGNHLYHFDCDEESFRSFWHPYFDLDEEYRAIREQIDPAADPFLWTAASMETGIRILRQDPWEMLITSVITQNRNIPAIQRSIEMLSEMAGEKKMDNRGMTYYAFPLPERIASLAEDQLIACKLGYRWKYVHAVAEAVHQHRIDLSALRCINCSDAIRELTGLYGIGNKVASCVALFGLHHLDAFPRDVWINRVLENEYPNGYPFEQYSPYNGVYQQYMFAYYRNRE